MGHRSYQSPFSVRYASAEMSHLFSAHSKAVLFRKLWLELAKAQQALGLPIQTEQIKEIESQIENIDFENIERHEKKLRHDVMAHIHAFGDVCPKAKPILHLGATSSYVADNADLIQLKEGFSLLLRKLISLVARLAELAQKHAADPALSYTHFQPAQPTTIGKRISLWLQDFLHDAIEWKRQIDKIPFLGVKGATGTQASFLALFEGDHKKVLLLEKKVAHAFGFQRVIPIAGQTYPRKIDLEVLNALESFAASAHKFGTDFRLLAHEGEMREPFTSSQVGSSAMPYKRNPIYCERICGLARFVLSLAQNPAYTAATQWLERSLDDSSNRRLSIPESFLAVDSILHLMGHVLSDPDIDVERSLLHCERYLPQLCMESILMEAVKRGGDRQQIHEKLRQLAFYSNQSPEEMIASIANDPVFRMKQKEVEGFFDVTSLLGRSEAQTREFLQGEVYPFLKENPPGDFKMSAVEL